MAEVKTTAIAKASPVDKIKEVLNAGSVKEQFDNALKENSGAFVASIIDLVGSDKGLQDCNPNLVIMECLKAATLKLPINKQLGFAYIICYKIKGVPTPQFQPGYKAYVQLAMRTGQYRYLNADAVYEGELPIADRVTGSFQIRGEQTSEKAIGYFAYMELINGFSKAVYMPIEKVISHAKRYSRNYNSDNSIWKTDFDSMAKKTVLKQLISKYGILSIEMQDTIVDEDRDIEGEISREIQANANQQTIDVTPPGQIESGDKQGEPNF